MTTEPGPLLIAYDGSEDAANAIARAGLLLAPRAAVVVHSFVGLSHLLLHSDAQGLSGPLAEAVQEFDAADAEEAEKLAAAGAELAAGAGFDAHGVVVKQHGQAWRTIVAAAEKRGAAALVCGARGRSAFAGTLLGSVANGIVDHSPVPVLVVPAEGAAEAPTGPVLICDDGSPAARHAVERASGILKPGPALALNLWQSWLAGVSFDVAAAAWTADRLDELARTRSGARAAEGAARASQAGLEAAPLSVRYDGPLWRGILEVADEQDASAIVIGSHGHGLVSTLLGSVSRRVVHHSRRPVLVVPAPVSHGARS